VWWSCCWAAAQPRLSPTPLSAVETAAVTQSTAIGTFTTSVLDRDFLDPAYQSAYYTYAT
jgi:hypothetical protein